MLAPFDVAGKRHGGQKADDGHNDGHIDKGGLFADQAAAFMPLQKQPVDRSFQRDQ